MALKITRISRWLLSVIMLALTALMLTANSNPVSADGGPMVDPMLFARLKEGQQVAVVRIKDAGTAHVDLFVSILDQTGESHEITYFVPLGSQATHFGVTEQNSIDFNRALTRDLDLSLFSATRRNEDTIHGLFAGMLLGNGAILAPLWYPLFFSGCGEGQPPVASFTTESSVVSVYDINETTDIQALVSTTGLDVSVTDTLSRLQGQQIAIIKMKTTSLSAYGGTSTEVVQGEPGLHLSWLTALKTVKPGSTFYAYPLGTGAAWSQPIELTRVYIIAPVDFSLSVDYPKLGAERSGYTRQKSSYEPRIAQAGEIPAYAVEKAFGVLLNPYFDINTGEVTPAERVNIWRVSYANSNAKEDIKITVKAGAADGLGASLRQDGIFASFFIGLAAAALFWVLSWYLLMPRLLHRSIKGLWYQPLIYLGINFLLLLVPGLLLFIMMSFGHAALAMTISVLLFGSAGVIIFIIRHLNNLGVRGGLAIRAFIIVTLASNTAYLLFALGYAKLAGAI